MMTKDLQMILLILKVVLDLEAAEAPSHSVDHRSIAVMATIIVALASSL